jgi:large subunit ribosomal protein L7A
VVGAKETKKALARGRVAVLYLARDAEERIVGPLREMASAAGVEIVEAPTMAELGKACGIDVGAAAAAILNTEGGAGDADD